MNCIEYKFSAVAFSELIFFFISSRVLKKWGMSIVYCSKKKLKIVNPLRESDLFHLCRT